MDLIRKRAVVYMGILTILYISICNHSFAQISSGEDLEIFLSNTYSSDVKDMQPGRIYFDPYGEVSQIQIEKPFFDHDEPSFFKTTMIELRGFEVSRINVVVMVDGADSLQILRPLTDHDPNPNFFFPFLGVSMGDSAEAIRFIDFIGTLIEATETVSEMEVGRVSMDLKDEKLMVICPYFVGHGINEELRKWRIITFCLSLDFVIEEITIENPKGGEIIKIIEP